MAKKVPITKVLSCFVVIVFLISAMPVSTFALDGSNNATEASNSSNDLVVYLNDTGATILTDVSNDTRKTVSALSCNVYVKIDDDTCVGYDVYVDGVYELTEGQGGTPDGYCAFYVTAGTHTIEIRKNGCSASITKNFECGVTYRWVSMSDYWCECGDQEGSREVKFRGTAQGDPFGDSSVTSQDVSVTELIRGGEIPDYVVVVLLNRAPKGYFDSSIQHGDKVEVYGKYSGSGCDISINGENYYIKKVEPSETLSINVWTDKSEYKIGETVTIYYQTNKKCTAKLTITKPDGGDIVYGPNEIPASTRSKSATAGYPTGKRTVVFEAWAGAEYKKATCYFDVLEVAKKVKIRGEILVDFPIISFYSFDVKIDKVLNDPTGNLKKGEIVNVYGHRDGPAQVDDVTVGDEVEVFGEYLGYVEGATFERIFLSDWGESSSDHYVKKIEEKKPDLVVQDISLHLENPKQGDTITFYVDIKNQGSGSAGVSYVYYYIDGSYVTSDSVPGLSAGSTSTQTFTWTANKCGNVEVKAIADATNAVDEGSNEGNNERTKTVSFICLFYIRPACQDVNGNPLDDVSYEFVDYPTYKGTCDYSEYLLAPGHGTYNVKSTKGNLEAAVTLESHLKPFAGTVVTLREKEGSIYATSTPSGANVHLDGTYKGTSPITIPNVPVGTHTVKYTKTGYEECMKTVTVYANQQMDVHCDLEAGETSIILKPPFDDAKAWKKLGEENSVSTSTAIVDAYSGVAKLYTSTTLKPGRSHGYAEADGIFRKSFYIPKNGWYKIDVSCAANGKIGGRDLSFIEFVVSYCYSKMGIFWGIKKENGSYVIPLSNQYFDTTVKTKELITDSIFNIIGGLANKIVPFAGQLIQPLLTPNERAIKIPGYINDTSVQYLEEGHYTFEVEVATGVHGMLFAAFGCPTIYTDFGTEDNYIALREVRIERILGTSNAAPRAIFTPLEAKGEINKGIRFDGTRSKDTDGEITDYYWEFENGNPSSFNYAYPYVKWHEPGTYQIKFKVKDNRGTWSKYVNGTVAIEDPTRYENKDIIKLDCPINTTITDQYGRIISDDGTNEIPDADMLITKETKIFYLPADLAYSVDIAAYDTGTFNFTRVSPIGNDISITKFENIPVTSSTKASVEIEPGVTDYTMSIDYDGDGTIDEERSPDVSEMIEITTPTTIVFEDDFSELNLNTWIPFGSPSPRVLTSAEGRTGVFDNNGDGWCNSGVVSKDNFSSPNGFTMESNIYLDVTDVAGCWNSPVIGLTRQNTPTGEGVCPSEDYPMGVIFGTEYDGDACWATPEEKRRHAYFIIGLYTEDGTWESFSWLNADDYADAWHNFKIAVGSDRIVKFYVDNDLIYTSEKRINETVLQEKKIFSGIRSSGSAGKSYHDYIKVYAATMPSTSNIIYVPDDYPTIQQAVNAANSGETINVRDGTYIENVDVNKPHLTIRSENGAKATIVQAASSDDHIFEVTADYVNIRGFTVGGASVTPSSVYLADVDYCNISNNIASNNNYGIYLYKSNSNLISNNIASNNDASGICLDTSSNSNIISNNIASNNNDYGIYLYRSNSNQISNNIASSNKEKGITLVYSNNNEIYLNNFINNADNVYPTGSINIWNSTLKMTYTYNGNTYTNYLGNYWSDYGGSDINMDGIGDTLYSIDSDKDNYPLMMPYENYFGVLAPKSTPTGSISVTSEPSGATIHLEVYAGPSVKTPFTFTDVPVGTYTLELSLDGYEDRSTNVSVMTGETSYVHGILDWLAP